MEINESDVQPEKILELSHKWLENRTGDMKFVLDSVKEAKEKETLSEAWFVESEKTGNEIQKILSMTDTEKIGLMGHSLGGAASVTVGRERDDIDAVIDLDGTMLGEQLSYENGTCQYYEEPYPIPILSIDNEEQYRQGKEGATYQGSDAFTEQKGTVISVGICVFVIFLLAHVVGWLQECVSAGRMTEELIRFQKNVK